MAIGIILFCQHWEVFIKYGANKCDLVVLGLKYYLGEGEKFVSIQFCYLCNVLFLIHNVSGASSAVMDKLRIKSKDNWKN